MAIKTNQMLDATAAAYGVAATHGAIYTSTPGITAGTEPSGGSPAYARKALTWSDTGNGEITATATFNVPASTTIVGIGVHDALTAGNYLDGATVTSQTFAFQGTLVVTFTFTQS